MNKLSLSLDSFIQAQINHPLQWIIDTTPIILGMVAYLSGVRQDYIEKLNEELEISLREQVQLTDKRNDDESDLQNIKKQFTELKSVTQITSEVANVQGIDEILEKTVTLISNKFGFYHAGIFLIDKFGDYAYLMAASSVGGQSLISRQYKCKIGKSGIVGYVARTGEPRIALDAGIDVVFLNNPELSQTRSEIALPLIVRDNVIGVLDLQSIEPNAFRNADISTLQTLADRIAFSIDNARELAKSRQSLVDLSKQYETQIAQAWSDYLIRPERIYEYNLEGVFPTNQSSLLIKGEIEDPLLLKFPILLNGHSLGSIILQRGTEDRPWSKDEIEFAEEVISRLALSLEHARIFEDTIRQSKRHRTASDIAFKLWNSSDFDTILQTAIRELGQSLDVADALIELNSEAV